MSEPKKKGAPLFARAARALHEMLDYLPRIKRHGPFLHACSNRALRPFHHWAIGLVRRFVQRESLEWNNAWFGIPLFQYPEDLLIYQEILHEIKPDLVIETGTNRGGLCCFLSCILHAVNPSGRILTVDYDASGWNRTRESIKEDWLVKLLDRVESLEGNSIDPAIVEKISLQAKKFGKVLVILDSRHTKDHVLAELRSYWPLVSVGSYLIVNDTHLDYTRILKYQPGPMTAVREFLEENRRYEIDHSKDRFVISCAIQGYLKRVG